MADIEDAIFSRLRTFSAASAVFSGRIYGQRVTIQDPKYPLCVYRIVSDRGFQAHDQAAGLFRSIFRFGCYGTIYGQAKRGANAVKTTFDGLRATVAGVRIDGALYQNQIDLFDEETNVRVHHTDVEVIFWHN